jgi:hypothetical protein
MKNMNSTGKLAKADSLGQFHKPRSKCNSVSQFNNIGSINNLMMGGLESIESDKEGEDL